MSVAVAAGLPGYDPLAEALADGHLFEQPEEIRVEAATYDGRLTSFTILGSWTRVAAAAARRRVVFHKSQLGEPGGLAVGWFPARVPELRSQARRHLCGAGGNDDSLRRLHADLAARRAASSGPLFLACSTSRSNRTRDATVRRFCFPGLARFGDDSAIRSSAGIFSSARRWEHSWWHWARWRWFSTNASVRRRR